VLRERVLVPRLRVAVDLRAVVLRAVVLRAVVLRAVAGLARDAAGLARVDADFARVLVDRVVDAFARVPPAFLRVPPDRFFRVAVLRVPAALRAPLDREPAELARVAGPSSFHLPDITRCAASATASAMIDPSFVALVMTVLVAADALSAASRPASRILRRAAGLALNAAAAAASPAASISLLIAALAILSMKSFDPDEDFEDFEDLEAFEDFFRADLAICILPPSRERHFKDVTVPNRARKCPDKRERNGCARLCLDMLKGTAASRSDALRHGQRPKVRPFVSV
jgi:hypothetical protein